jgi:hypothetical protein
MKKWMYRHENLIASLAFFMLAVLLPTVGVFITDNPFFGIPILIFTGIFGSVGIIFLLTWTAQMTYRLYRKSKDKIISTPE